MTISATITLVDITAHADKGTFYMTTKDPAQVKNHQETFSYELKPVQ